VSLIDSAGADAAKVRENIETWFNTAMDRLSGRYKRRTQNVVFLLGMLLAGLMNVDSVKIADALSHDAALRNSLVAAAQEYVKNPPPTVGQPVPATPVVTPPAPVVAPVPAAGAPAAKPAAPAPSAPTPAPAKTPADDIKSLSEKIGSLGLPLGWKKDATSWTDPLELLQKILGLLITSLAITLGAPFWFDTLNRIINVRGAIKPQTPAK
jgi:hypothetical protein